MACLLSLLLLLLLLDIGYTFHGNLVLSSSNNSTSFQPGKAYFSTQKSSSFWVSPNGELTFGFKSLAIDEYLLSIWFSADPNQTAIWWPAKLTDNNNPIVTTGAVFNFTSQGSLQLSDAIGKVVWSTDSISNVSFAELQNTGNLVLLDESQINILWQSFADLRDSLMLPQHGGSTDEALVINKPYLLQSRANQSSFVAGRFHLETDYSQNLYLHALDQRHNLDFIYMYASMNVSGNFEISQDFGKKFIGNGLMPASRLTLDEDGNLRIYSWNSSTKSWQEIWQIVDDRCKLGSPCGSYGICSEDAGGTVNCICPPGYYALDAEDPSQGCGSSSNFSAICASGGNTNDGQYSMAELDHSDYYYNDLNVGGQLGDIDECKTLCLNKCTCVAASHRNSDNTCFLKGNETTELLMNGYSTGGNTLFIKVASSPAASGSGVTKRVDISIGVATVVVLVVIFSCSAWLLKRRRLQRRWGGQQEVEMHTDTGPMRFTYQQMVEATNNFAELLGEGGFGNVYKGWVMQEKNGNGSERVVVAVKVLKTRVHEEEKQMQDEAEKQFRAEVSTLGKIHHVNLVNLFGYCTGERAGEKRVLVYEYIEKGSLDRYFSKVHIQEQPLSWPIRYSIALGTARGIAYLHHDCNPRIVHCDIKPQNVLLDHDFTAKVADFGFAKRFQNQKSHLTVSGVRGTRGYMAPEWLTSDEVTPKVDVYSFGMVLLQLARGFPDRDDDGISLVDWAFKGIEEYSAAVHCYDYALHSDHGNVSKTGDDEQRLMIDISSGELEQKLQLLKIGLWCVQYLPALRPSMARIVQLIEGSSPEDVEKPPYPAPRMSIGGCLPSILAADSEQSSSSTNVYSNSNSILSGR